MNGTAEPTASGRAILTVPNLLSFLRILLIPVFVALIVDPDTTTRRRGAVRAGGGHRLGRRLRSRAGPDRSPSSGRSWIPSPTDSRSPPGLIALMVRGAFPLWAARR